MIRQPPRSTLFPYPALFRSDRRRQLTERVVGQLGHVHDGVDAGEVVLGQPPDVLGESRSEEHTSELQSRQYLVCRLLLEKKNQRAATALPPRRHLERRDGLE